MAMTPHVNGPCLISVGNQGDFATVGTPGRLAPDVLGWTDGGPRISIQSGKDAVIADNAGPFVPTDIQDFGMVATIGMAMVVFDQSVLASRILAPDGIFEGVTRESGVLVFQSNKGFRLIFSSPIDGTVWRFPWCYFESCDVRPGSKYSIYDCIIKAIPYVANDTLITTTLYDRLNV